MFSHETNQNDVLSIVLAALIFVVFTFACALNLFFLQYEGFVLLWPASGVGIACLLLCGRRNFPLLFLGAALAALWSGHPWLNSLGFAFVVSAGILCAYFVVKAVKIRGFWARFSFPLGLIFAAVCGPGINALLGGWLLGAPSTEICFRWWWGGGIGVGLIVPLVVSLKTKKE